MEDYPADELTPDEVVGRAVRRLREASGLTQARLAEKLSDAGWASGLQSSVAELERGRRRVSLGDLVLIARVLDVTPQSLMAVRPNRPVRVGARAVSADDWHEAMRVTDEDKTTPRRSTPPSSILPLLRHKPTPPEMIERVVREAREEDLSQRKKYPGPTFVSEVPRTLLVQIPAWGGTTAVIKLKPNEPHVARDRLEAERLRAAMHEGLVRRIDRHEARRMRLAAERGRKR
jgi:transcriptional regulator with XRE-family HTH domain